MLNGLEKHKHKVATAITLPDISVVLLPAVTAGCGALSFLGSSLGCLTISSQAVSLITHRHEDMSGTPLLRLP